MTTLETNIAKERPILFSGEMVRAILEGRKTQTRRVISKQPLAGENVRYNADNGYVLYGPEFMRQFVKCPYGQPSDRLWVRESWALDGSRVVYMADLSRSGQAWVKWKPSIHMRREYSRINLEITGVRVERLQDIKNKDAIAEGVSYDVSKPQGSPVARYQTLWEKINGGESWDANPWVWVVEFKRI